MYDFTYRRPADLAEAVALLGADEEARPLSGGQTLMPVLRARLAAPTSLVDLSRLSALRDVTETAGGIQIGAAVTHAEVAAHSLVHNAIPALSQLAGGIGDVQVRHRGTIGGSVANNDPAACYPSACLALDARIVTDRRELAAADFFTGLFSTALETGEVVTAVRFPACAQAVYLKFHNPASRFALIGVFAARHDGTVRIAVTGGGTGVFRWRGAEALLAAGGDADLRAAVLDPMDFTGDLHGSAEYRQHLTRTLTQRALAHLS